MITVIYTVMATRPCKFTTFGPSCPSNAREDKPDAADIRAILDWHNSIREKVASGRETGAKDGTLPKASNMRKLVWDKELAYIAQSRFNYVGQNVASLQTTGTLTSINFVTLIHPFYSKEVQNLPKSVIYSFSGSTSDKPYGHYTQVIWANTKAVGCGGVIYEKSGWKHALVVCNYGEAGNFIGSPVYKTGIPCSECPSGTSCSGSLCGEFFIVFILKDLKTMVLNEKQELQSPLGIFALNIIDV
ncbi:Venom allergen 5 [Armadillidium vulgare]|nr:Venom allergen 5 [Armadillidium vulgare]